MTSMVQKVTCFIIRGANKNSEVLLLIHPEAGIQFPAGTVEPGEDIEAAARREAAEETGINGLVLMRFLGESDDPPPAGFLFVAHPTPVYSRPDANSFDWVNFRTGLPVRVLRHKAGFTQVSYDEPNRFPNPEYSTYTITGWVHDDVLTDQRRRNFYLFESHNLTPPRWTVNIDNHLYELFWAPLHHLPAIVPPQDGWLKWLMGTD